MKILIIGNGGTGKSTLAQKMGETLAIPVTYLDLVMWNKDWDRLSEKEFTKALANITCTQDWIIEGWGYHSTLFNRIEKADIIVYLQYPLAFCLKSVLERNKKYNNKKILSTPSRTIDFPIILCLKKPFIKCTKTTNRNCASGFSNGNTVLRNFIFLKAEQN